MISLFLMQMCLNLTDIILACMKDFVEHNKAFLMMIRVIKGIDLLLLLLPDYSLYVSQTWANTLWKDWNNFIYSCLVSIFMFSVIRTSVRQNLVFFLVSSCNVWFFLGLEILHIRSESFIRVFLWFEGISGGLVLRPFQTDGYSPWCA